MKSLLPILARHDATRDSSKIVQDFDDGQTFPLDQAHHILRLPYTQFED